MNIVNCKKLIPVIALIVMIKIVFFYVQKCDKRDNRIHPLPSSQPEELALRFPRPVPAPLRAWEPLDDNEDLSDTSSVVKSSDEEQDSIKEDSTSLEESSVSHDHEEDLMPHKEDSMSFEKSFKEDSTSLEEDSMSLEEDSISSDEESIFLEEDSISSDEESRSLQDDCSASKKFTDFDLTDQLLIKVNTEVALRCMQNGMVYVDKRHSYLLPLRHPRVRALGKAHPFNSDLSILHKYTTL